MAPDESALCVPDILKVARKANQDFQITGVLLFDGEHFIQYIEGPPEAIHQLMDNIRGDARHQQVEVLVDAPLHDLRRFADWRMGYVYREDGSIHNLLKQANAEQALQQFAEDIADCDLL